MQNAAAICSSVGMCGSQSEYPDSIVADFGQPHELNDWAGRVQYRNNEKHWYWGAT